MCSKGYIDVDVFDYGLNGSYVVDGVYSLEVSMAEIIRACLNSGKGDNPKNVTNEVDFRTSLIKLMLEEKIIGKKNSRGTVVCKIKRFVLSEVFCNLDPSEKGAVSFFFGMAIAGVVAQEYFKIAWLLHYDLYRRRYHIPHTQGEKPDLLGPERGDDNKWHIFEAKGRSSGFDKKAMEHAKMQKRKASLVNGGEIKSANVVQSYFKGDDRELCIYLADPPIIKGEDIKIDLKKFFVLYYGMVHHFLNEIKDRFGEREKDDGKTGGVYVETIAGQKFDMAYYACLDIHIGLLRRIRERIESFESGHSDHARYVDKNEFYFPHKSVGNVSIGSDGIIVKLGESWQI